MLKSKRSLVLVAIVYQVLIGCASTFYTSEKRSRNNTTTLVSTSKVKITFPKALPKDVDFYNREINLSNEPYVLEFSKLRKRLLLLQIESENATKIARIKRVPRGGAVLKSVGMGLFSYGLPLIIDPFNPDFYRISDQSRIVNLDGAGRFIPTLESKNSTLSSKKSDEGMNEKQSSPGETVDSPIARYETESVTLTQIGQGRTKDEAKYNALRNAIEKAFGAFISSNTTVINDELIKDEIVAVSSGNIQNFEILSETQMPDGSYSSVVKATVSIGKLTKFCESKGISVEFKGGLFAANIRLQELNRENELQVFENLKKVINEILTKGVFDYSIEVQNPSKIPGNNQYWGVPIKVESRFNKNLIEINTLLYEVIKAICLSNSDVENMKSMKVNTYSVGLNGETFYLRNRTSIDILNSLFSRSIMLESSNFEITNGVCQKKGREIFNSLYDQSESSQNYGYYNCQFMARENVFIVVKCDIASYSSRGERITMSSSMKQNDWLRFFGLGLGGFGYDQISLDFRNFQASQFTFIFANIFTTSELAKITEYKIEHAIMQEK